MMHGSDMMVGSSAYPPVDLNSAAASYYNPYYGNSNAYLNQPIRPHSKTNLLTQF